MGHTLVARFQESDLKLICDLIRNTVIENCNKIPFGRDCDRTEADSMLPYHVTVAHWAKSEDEFCISRIKYLQAHPCMVWADTPSVMLAEENSVLLYFNIRPSKEFVDMAAEVDRLIPGHLSFFWHMTLNVSKDHDRIREMAQRLKDTAAYPIPLHVTGLDLYHIWKPVKLVRSF